MIPEDPTPTPLSEVDRLLIACVEAQLEGGVPALEQICAAHPDAAAELRLRYQCLQEVGFLQEGAAPAGPAPGRLGDFRILATLGRGGMGIVYLAEQQLLQRRVALKVLRPEALVSSVTRERFRREGLTLSKLEHPGICPVYEVGEIEGMPYMAMRYLEGRTLAQHIRAARDAAASICAPSSGQEPSASGPPTPTGRVQLDTLLRVFERLARAVATAHGSGLVHRDLKPANIMITPAGDPVILDFGLAYDESSGHGLTQSGDALGTPAYMAPEQIEAQHAVDARTDVYALGVCLYECATLARPFEASSREALYKQILTGDARSVRSRNPKLPRDLAVIIGKAMDRVPSRRYQTMDEFADDLRRLRTQEPIRARRAGWMLRTLRWSQRNRLATAFVVLLATGLTTTVVLLRRVEDSLQQTRSIASAFLAAKAAATAPKAALWLALEADQVRSNVETRSQLYAGLALSHEQRRFVGHTAPVWGARFAPQGDRLVSCSNDGTARVWDLQDPGAAPVVLRHRTAGSEPAQVHDARFARGGRRVVTATFDGTGRVWDPRRPQRALWTFEVPEGARRPPTSQFLVGPDDRTGLLLRWDGALLVDLATGRELWPLPHPGQLEAGGFSPDGALVATAVGYGRERRETDRFTVRLFRVEDGLLLHELRHQDSVHFVRFSADSRTLLTGSHDGLARFWDTGTGQERRGDRLDHGDQIWRGGFLPVGTGEGIVLGGNGGVRLRRATGLQQHLAKAFTMSIGFGRDGRFVTAHFDDNTARLFDARGVELLVARGHRHWVQHAMLSPDGRRMATASWDHTVRVWRVEDPELVPFGVQARMGDFDRAADGTALWHTTDTVHVGDVVLRGELAVLPHALHSRTRFGPAGERFARVLGTGHVEVHRRDGKRLGGFEVGQGHSRGCLAVLLDEARLIVSEHPRPAEPGNPPIPARLSLRDLSGQVVGFDLDPGLAIVDVAIDAEHRRFAVAGNSGACKTAAVLGFDGRTQLRYDRHDAEVVSVAFSPDGTRLVSGANDGKARLFRLEAPTSEPVVLEGHTAAVSSVAFAPDGARVVTGSKDGTARIWSTDGHEWHEWARIEAGLGEVKRVLWTRDGEREWIWTSCKAGVRRWPARLADLRRLVAARSRPDSAAETRALEKLAGSVNRGR